MAFLLIKSNSFDSNFSIFSSLIRLLMVDIQTKTEHIVLEDNGLIYCTVLKGLYMDLSDAKENLEAINTLAKGKRVPVLVDIRQSKGVSQKCRAYFAGDEAAQIQSACALLIESPLSKLIGNFFIGFNKTKFPTKLFTDESSARAWLSSFVVPQDT